MTDVTLRVGTGYRISFLDITTDTQVYAQSSDFEVKAPGSQYIAALTLVFYIQSDILSI